LQKISLTGGTGFVGRRLVDVLGRDDRELTCLARNAAARNLPIVPGLDWLSGRVEDADAQRQLVAGADTVIHVAGLTKALGRDGFHRTNVEATAALVMQARKAGVRHFILVSSLAASRPEVSAYAASKALAESAARRLSGNMQLTIIRPPAVLGPGDDATRDVMHLLRRGWMVYPSRGQPAGRFSWIDVGDLARFILSVVDAPSQASDHILAPSSGPQLSWDDVADAAEAVLNRKVRRIGLPAALVRSVGVAADFTALVSRHPFILSGGKANELLQRDWQSDFVVDVPTPLHQTLSHCFLDTHRQEGKLSGRRSS